MAVTRAYTAREILETEERYVDALTTLVEVFYQPLKSAASSEKSIVKTEKLRLMFPPEIEIILNYNKMLLKGLREALKSWRPCSRLGNAFLKIVRSSASLFSAVCSSYFTFAWFSLVSRVDRVLESLHILREQLRASRASGPTRRGEKPKIRQILEREAIAGCANASAHTRSAAHPACSTVATIRIVTQRNSRKYSEYY
jgi:hypothetical protein